MDFKIISLNTRGFKQSFRDFLFLNLLFECDIFCFQETQVSDSSVLRSFAGKWRGSCFWSPAFGKQGGVITCFSDSFDYEIIQWKKDTSGRVVSVAIKVNNYRIISKVLTSRLSKVLEFIVNPDQTCSVPGRSIFSNFGFLVLGFSKLLYLAKVLLVPSWVFIQINSIVWPFLWGCRMETVARNTCYLKVKNLSLIHI